MDQENPNFDMGKNSWIGHPYDPSRKLILMFDPVHVLKICRNILERSRRDHETGTKGNYLLLEGKPIVWDFIMDCYEDDVASKGHREFYDLTKAVCVLDHFAKMNVNKALKVILSHDFFLTNHIWYHS